MANSRHRTALAALDPDVNDSTFTHTSAQGLVRVHAQRLRQRPGISPRSSWRSPPFHKQVLLTARPAPNWGLDQSFSASIDVKSCVMVCVANFIA